MQITNIETGRLDKLAKRIRDDIELRTHSRGDWIKATLDLAGALAEARNHFNDNISFGHWCDESQFDLSKDDRAAYIAFGREPERARLVLEQSKSSSVQLIHKKEFRFRSATKTTKPKTAKAAPKTDAALAAYDELKAAGVEPSRDKVMEKAGVGDHPAQLAITKRRAQEALGQTGPDVADLSKTSQAKVEAAIRKIQQRMEREFETRVQERVRKHTTEYIIPVYGERLAFADRVLETTKKPFSIEEYRKLLGALHPDSSSVERRTEMFRLVKERELLLRPADKVKPLSGDLPKTIEELLARRKVRR